MFPVSNTHAITFIATGRARINTLPLYGIDMFVILHSPPKLYMHRTPLALVKALVASVVA